MPIRAHGPSFALLSLGVLLAAACKGGDDGGATVDAATDGADVAIDAAVDAPSELPFEDDLGHVSRIEELTRSGDRALSVDSSGHWVLWDLADRRQVARGESVCGTCAVPRVELRGDLVSVRVPTGLELRSATTGAVTATIPTSVLRVGTASDGSYVWAATATGLRTWRPDGSPLVTVAGDYRTGIIRGVPNELRIAAGPAGPMAIETVRLADSTRSTIPFNGTFIAWFIDETKFLTATGTVVRVYRLDGTIAGLGSVNTTENLTGQGDYVWTVPNLGNPRPLTIYPVASIGTPAQTYDIQGYAPVVAGGTTIAIFDSSQQSMSIVSLGAAITRTAAIPVDALTLTTYAADAGGWLIGDGGGVLRTGVDATLGGPLDRGKLTSVAGSEAGVAALANSAGAIELVRVGAAPVVTRTIPLASPHVELSTDGATLVVTPVTQLDFARPLRVLDVATGAVTHTWPYSRLDDPSFLDFTFARTGLILEHYFQDRDGMLFTYPRILTRTDGTVLPDYGPPISVTDAPSRIGGLHLFSPSGERAAITPATQYLTSATTMLYQGGQLAEAVNGVATGWIDDDRVLVAKYRYAGNTGDAFVSNTIYNGAGTVLAVSPLTDLRAIEGGATVRNPPVVVGVGQGQIYLATKNVVYDPVTGAVVWRGPAGSVGHAVAGDHVVYTVGTRLVVERFR